MPDTRPLSAHDIARSRMKEPQGSGIEGSVRRVFEYQMLLRQAMEEKARGEWITEEPSE